MNIVIVDDDIVVSGALKTILEASGDITVSATGTDGKSGAAGAGAGATSSAACGSFCQRASRAS